MRREWLARIGPVRCDRCGRPIAAGDPFRLVPYCPMGGRLDLAPEALPAFADALEVAAFHADCAAAGPPAPRWSIPVKPPFSLEKTSRALQRLPANETQVWREGALLRGLHVGRARVWLRVTQPDPVSVEIELLDVARTAEIREAVTEAVRWMLALDFDLEPFAERASRFPALFALFHALAGLKPPRFPDLFETFVNTLLFQQISLHAGTALLNRLARRFGETCQTPWGAVRRVPTAEEAVEIPPEALAEIGFSRHKARSLVALAREIAGGGLGFAGVRRHAYGRARSSGWWRCPASVPGPPASSCCAASAASTLSTGDYRREQDPAQLLPGWR